MKTKVKSSSIRYFDIDWLSRFDGPGRRVVVFLQGCNLRCPWCHSPHSQNIESSLLFFPALCQHCGYCEQVCDHGVHKVTSTEHVLNRENCIRCGKCIDICPVSNCDNGALVLPTKEITITDLWHLIYPQLDLVRNIGGLTLSGGEALLQSDALKELLYLCKKEGFHTTVETSGAISPKHIIDVVDYVDCWLYGLRPTLVYTPPLANQITKNLSFLCDMGNRIIVRTPLINGITDLPDSLEQIIKIMHANKLSEIQLLPFHKGTSHFYNALGEKCNIGEEAIPSTEKLNMIQNYFMKKNITASIIQ